MRRSRSGFPGPLTGTDLAGGADDPPAAGTLETGTRSGSSRTAAMLDDVAWA